MAEMYAQVLEHAGYSVKTQLNLASRQVSDAALFHGDIDLKPEYVAYELATLAPKANSSGPASQVLPRLKAALARKSVDTLNFTPANDTNAFVVTRQTATKYHLSKISDLAKPAS
jgi:osmoprotectant transport system substrate-binding protein